MPVATAFETADLYLASFLLTRGYKLVGKRHEGHRIVVLFEDSAEIHEASMEFYNCEARRLFDSFRVVKDFCFERSK